MNLFNSDHDVCLQKLPHGEPRLVPYSLIPGGWLDRATSLISINTKLGMLPFKKLNKTISAAGMPGFLGKGCFLAGAIYQNSLWWQSWWEPAVSMCMQGWGTGEGMC